MPDQIKNQKRIIYFNGRFLTQSMTGVQRFAWEILTALDSLLENDEAGIGSKFICLIPANENLKSEPHWKNIGIEKCGRLKGNLWEQIDLPKYAASGLLVNLCNIGPLFHKHQVLVFHDASVFAVPQAYSTSFKIKYRIIMYSLAHASNYLLTDSQFSKNELAHYLKINTNRFFVIPLGCDHILRIEPDDAILQQNGLTDRPYLLTVGSSSPHKNIISLEKAINTLPENSIDLVIAGGEFSKVFTQIETVNSKNIKRIGYVTDGELRSLYTHATGFVFPSLYEGFGFPTLEAMTCGCPVLSSNRASLPEICGDAALYFDPKNISEIKSAINQLIGSNLLQSSLKQKGYERVSHYTWKNSAVELLRIIKIAAK